ncbi:MAG: NAD(FAD)-utilizing dehydrogenase [Clostridiales Family XIII bacterium]|jgi:uncharacterized FAD-dependent dehydrogenase|nr:NAD(FAD)-utilizing dehydrogenase [Clostridiales Family XIII bacterium]
MLRIREIKLKPGEAPAAIPRAIEKRCAPGRFGYALSEWRVAAKSVDARDKARIRFVYSVDFSVTPRAGAVKLRTAPEDFEADFLRRLRARGGGAGIEAAPAAGGGLSFVARGAAAARARVGPAPVIVGFGPCGMFAALTLAAHGRAPVVLERGKDADARVADVNRFLAGGALDPESNVQFGEGGAGTFSDGKLTTGIKDPRVGAVLETLAQAGGGDEILCTNKPHIGTDVLRVVVKKLRARILSLGGTVLFEHKLAGLCAQGGALRAVLVDTPRGTEELPAEVLLLATGHSARDSFAMLRASGVRMTPKPFSVGLRIEHPQRLIDAAQYGEHFTEIYGMAPREAGLPPADYKLALRTADGRGLYTFCMCPGGVVIPAASEPFGTVTNGMSERARAGAFANSALLVEVRVSDFAAQGDPQDPLAGIAFQRTCEQRAFASEAAPRPYFPPTERLADFMGKESALAACLPAFAAEAIREGLPRLGEKLKGFDLPEARLYGVETRSSSPVRIPRGQDLCTNIRGLYAGGEGAGCAGGIVSAAVDGIRLAEAILKL